MNSSQSDIADRLLYAQAELQTALGLYRLRHREPDAIADRMQASLALQHSLMADLGLPMMESAALPEGWTPA